MLGRSRLGRPVTLKQIGEVFGITGEAVRFRVLKHGWANVYADYVMKKEEA